MPGLNGFLGFPFFPMDAAKRWALWDEGYLSDLASDDIFVVLFNNATAGGADVGQGCGLTGTDATFTCNGSVPGFATYGRYNSTGYGWYIPQAVNDLLLGEDEWTVVLKLYNYSGMGYNTNTGVLYMYSGEGSQYLTFFESNGGVQSVQKGTLYAQYRPPACSNAYSWHYWWRKDGQINTGYSAARQTTVDGLTGKGTAVTTDNFNTQRTGTKAVGWWPGYSVYRCYYTYMIVARKCLLA